MSPHFLRTHSLLSPLILSLHFLLPFITYRKIVEICENYFFVQQKLNYRKYQLNI